MGAGDSIYAALTSLHTSEGKIRQVSRSLSSAKSVLGQITADMESEWSGKAKDLYKEGISGLSQKLNALSEEMEKRADQLRDSLQVYEEKEAMNQAAADNLSADNIF